MKRRTTMLKSGTDHPGENAQQASNENNIQIKLGGYKGREHCANQKEADRPNHSTETHKKNQKENQQKRTGRGGNGRKWMAAVAAYRRRQLASAADSLFHRAAAAQISTAGRRGDDLTLEAQ